MTSVTPICLLKPLKIFVEGGENGLFEYAEMILIMPEVDLFLM